MIEEDDHSSGIQEHDPSIKRIVFCKANNIFIKLAARWRLAVVGQYDIFHITRH